MYLGLSNLGLNQIKSVASGGGLPPVSEYTTNGKSVGSLMAAQIPTIPELEVLVGVSPITSMSWNWVAYDPTTQAIIDGTIRSNSSTYTIQAIDIGLAIAVLVLFEYESNIIDTVFSPSDDCQAFWYNLGDSFQGIGLITA